MGERVLLPLGLPMDRSWANVIDEEEAARPQNWRRGPVRIPRPRSGNMVTRNGRQMIYTERPVIRPNGSTVRGMYVRAIDPEGDYGGPYSDLRNFMRSAQWGRYMSNIEDLQKDERAFKEYQRARAAATRRGSRSRSGSRRSRGTRSSSSRGSRGSRRSRRSTGTRRARSASR